MGEEFYVVEDESLEAQVGMIPHHVRHWQMWCKEEDEYSFDTEAYYNGLLENYRNGNFQVVVAYDAEKFPVGSVAISTSYSPARSMMIAWVDELYVLPEWRGSGVGWNLMEAAERVARQQGAVEALCSTQHEKLVKLYEKYGWKRYVTMLRYQDV